MFTHDMSITEKYLVIKFLFCHQRWQNMYISSQKRKYVKYDRLVLFPGIVYNEYCKDSIKSEPSQNVYCIIGFGRSHSKSCISYRDARFFYGFGTDQPEIMLIPRLISASLEDPSFRKPPICHKSEIFSRFRVKNLWQNRRFPLHTMQNWSCIKAYKAL